MATLGSESPWWSCGIFAVRSDYSLSYSQDRYTHFLSVGKSLPLEDFKSQIFSPFSLGVWCLIAKLCLALLRPHELGPTRLFCPWNFPNKNIGVGCHFLMQGIFPTQGQNLCLLHWRAESLPLSHREASIVQQEISKVAEKRVALRDRAEIKYFHFLQSKTFKSQIKWIHIEGRRMEGKNRKNTDTFNISINYLTTI